MAIKSGEKKLTARQQAAKVREWTGWTREQYNKQYDILRNRVRAYERATGKTKGSINVADLLAREERRKYFNARIGGEGQKQSFLYQAVMTAPSTSSGRALSRASSERLQAAGFDYLFKRYEGILERSRIGQDIMLEFSISESLGNGTPAELERIIEKHLREFDAERRNIAAFNRGNPDPARRMYFHST